MQNQQIILIHGKNYKQMTKQLLQAAGLADEIGSRDTPVALKPNLVIGAPASRGATTHPELVAGVLEYLQENGFRDLRVIEGSWVGSRTSEAVQTSGLLDVCRQYRVPFIDLQKDASASYDAKGMQIKVCNEAMRPGFLINMPVLKGHGQTLITCALKNAKGLIPNSEKRRFHALGLHAPIAHLNALIHWEFILVDNICGDLDFEEGGNPVEMDRIFACKDPVLCDSFVCRTMGYQPQDVPYIPMAEALGVGSTDLSAATITALNEPAQAITDQRPSRRVQALMQPAAPATGLCCTRSTSWRRTMAARPLTIRSASGRITAGRPAVSASAAARRALPAVSRAARPPPRRSMTFCWRI